MLGRIIIRQLVIAGRYASAFDDGYSSFNEPATMTTLPCCWQMIRTIPFIARNCRFIVRCMR